MSNLISHPKQSRVINLDTVGSVYHRIGISPVILFTYPPASGEYESEVQWEFETIKEAGQVYDKIIGTFALVL